MPIQCHTLGLFLMHIQSAAIMDALNYASWKVARAAIYVREETTKSIVGLPRSPGIASPPSQDGVRKTCPQETKTRGEDEVYKPRKPKRHYYPSCFSDTHVYHSTGSAHKIKFAPLYVPMDDPTLCFPYKEFDEMLALSTFSSGGDQGIEDDEEKITTIDNSRSRAIPTQRDVVVEIDDRTRQVVSVIDDDDDQKSRSPVTTVTTPDKRLRIPLTRIPLLYLSSLSFSACGLHVFYHTGVAHSLLDRHIIISEIICTSAGVFASLYYILDWRNLVPLTRLLQILPVGDLRLNSTFLDNAIGWISWATNCLIGSDSSKSTTTTGSSPSEFIQSEMRTAKGTHLARLKVLDFIYSIFQTDPNIYKKVNGKLFIVLTEWSTLSRHVFSQWDNNDDLFLCICATTDIPMIAGKPRMSGQKWRGKTWVDGGFRDLHPIRDHATVCVSTTPFTVMPRSEACLLKSNTACQMAEIGREVDPYGALHVLFPHYYEQLFKVGYYDSSLFVRNRLRSTMR